MPVPMTKASRSCVSVHATFVLGFYEPVPLHLPLVNTILSVQKTPLPSFSKSVMPCPISSLDLSLTSSFGIPNMATQRSRKVSYITSWLWLGIATALRNRMQSSIIVSIYLVCLTPINIFIIIIIIYCFCRMMRCHWVIFPQRLYRRDR